MHALQKAADILLSHFFPLAGVAPPASAAALAAFASCFAFRASESLQRQARGSSRMPLTRQRCIAADDAVMMQTPLAAPWASIPDTLIGAASCSRPFLHLGTATSASPLLPLLRRQAILIFECLPSSSPLGSSRPINLPLIASSHAPCVQNCSYQRQMEEKHKRCTTRLISFGCAISLQ